MDLQTTQQQRITMLEEQLKIYQKPTVNLQPQNQPESMEAMISRLIDEKLMQLSSQVSQQQPEPIDYGTQLLVAVGSALTEEQQMWLSEESNRLDIPRFLSSIEGQAITRRFFSTYKQFKETQCK